MLLKTAVSFMLFVIPFLVVTAFLLRSVCDTECKV